MDVDEYLEASKEWKRDSTQWTENNARIFNLVLQHCHPAVEAELKNHTNWLVARSDQDSIALLLMIRDMTHNMKDSKQGTMAIVETAVEVAAVSPLVVRLSRQPRCFLTIVLFQFNSNQLITFIVIMLKKHHSTPSVLDPYQEEVEISSILIYVKLRLLQ